MSHFYGSPTPLEEHVIEEMRAFQVGHGDLQRAYAEVVYEDRRRQWMNGHGIERLVDDKPCLYRLLGKRCRHDTRTGQFGDCDGHDHLGFDHTTLGYRATGGPIVLITQPYDIGPERLKRMTEAAAHFGLDLDIDSLRSWHFPSWTLLVTFWAPGAWTHAYGRRG